MTLYGKCEKSAQADFNVKTLLEPDMAGLNTKG